MPGSPENRAIDSRSLPRRRDRGTGEQSMNASQETKHSGGPIANVAGLSQQLRQYSYVILIAAFAAGPAFPQTIPPLSSNVSVYATGLNNPRGMKFGPDGALYVAEGGMGGTASSVGVCAQVVAPIGPYTGGN